MVALAHDIRVRRQHERLPRTAAGNRSNHVRAARIALGELEARVLWIGAVFGELVGARAGLGYLMIRAIAQFETPRMVAKMPDHDLWIGFVKDMDGNLVGLMSEVRR